MIKLLQKLLPQSNNQAFWLSFFLCLFFCGLILFIVAPITGLSKNFGMGNDGYIQLARSLAAGNGYVLEKGDTPVFHRPPLYPLFLVPVALFPENLQRYVIVIPQSILVGFIGMMIFKIARLLYNQNIAIMALLLFLINPWVYWNAKNPMTPVLQTFLYLMFSYFAAFELFEIFGLFGLAKKTTIWFRGLIIGIFGAALALTHAAMLPVVLLYIITLLIVAIIKDRKKILMAVIAGFVVICLIAPWTYRNYVVFGRFIPVAGNAGLAYFNGNVHWNFIEKEPQRTGETYKNASLRVLGIEGTPTTITHWEGFKDSNLEEFANKKMVEHIRNHPDLFIKKVMVNAVDYYFPVFVSHFLAVKSTVAEDWAVTLFHCFLWFPVIWGVFHCWQKGLLLLGGIVIYSVWYFPFVTSVSHSLYTMGTMPFLCILSATGIVYFFREEKHATC